MSTHRQILVTGVPTAGKTAFCHELVKKFFVQHIQTDPIVTAFQDVFPQLGITHKAGSQDLTGHLAVCEKFRPFLFRWIDDLQKNDFVIEGFRMPAEEIIKRYGPTHQIFVFGYPNASPEECVARCREFDKNNWTNGVSDEDLKNEFVYLIEESRRLEELCKEYKVPFINTGEDYSGAIQKALSMVR
ncbi:MAG: hypothetical protein Q7R62_00060 [bacterium]|nr:hypothetical protein [bacterium]